ncbi:MAG: methylenetetrahydrofolate reductase [Desulfovibrio sp.]|jgi:methylenetetrahydrofolate reductase (NADPH)|nr:methylenetetrahydrofolate reductase [Desulfovibrio sp.]
MHIGSMISGASNPFFSLEFFPPVDESQLPSFFNTAERLRILSPLFVSVTHGASGSQHRNTLAVTAELARRDFTCMPHLTCVGAEPGGIAQFLRELRAASVDNVLALRGDTPAWQSRSAEEHFKHAGDLVAFIRANAPDMGIGVAAYPAPHPESLTFTEDREYTAQKLRSGADFAVTQLFFDVREYENLVTSLRVRGVNTPVVPGILPIQSFDSLRRVLSMCGANIPGNFYLDLEEALRNGGEEALREAGLKFAVRQIRHLLDMGAPGIHLYTLNRSELCLRIADEAKLGRSKSNSSKTV